MAIFDRILRTRRTAEPHGGVGLLAPVPAHHLPHVNQRVSISIGDHVPVPSRVEDITGGAIVLAAPALALVEGDEVLVSWEGDATWCSLTTRVLVTERGAAVPTIDVAAAGRLTRHDERRGDVRSAVNLPVDLRTVRARAIRPGRELQVRTTEVSGTAIRFASSAPFAPGDVVEAKITLGDGSDDVVGARVRVIRVDAVTGSWRSTVTATFDEVLRSDRAKLVAVAATIAAAQGTANGPEPALAGMGPMSSPPTPDGIGGRDEPESLSSLDNVVEWLKRRG